VVGSGSGIRAASGRWGGSGDLRAAGWPAFWRHNNGRGGKTDGGTGAGCAAHVLLAHLSTARGVAAAPARAAHLWHGTHLSSSAFDRGAGADAADPCHAPALANFSTTPAKPDHPPDHS
jgi:hypothetical protein